MPYDYSTVTEKPGDEITREAASMLVSRYTHAASYCAGKDVLEIACGCGLGLSFIQAHARSVVGADRTQRLLDIARRRYGARIPLIQLDAERLPFASSTFDVVILHEAIYYLPSAERFLDEARRVLRAAGRLILSTVNREWSDFNPSPFSHRYPTAAELRTLLERRFAGIEIRGQFLVSPTSLLERSVSLLKRAAVRLRLIPRTMSGKRLLKRIFLGKLVPVPAEITADLAPYVPPVLVPRVGGCAEYKVLYAVAIRP